MMKLALSPAAAGLLRALIAGAGIDRDRILLTAIPLNRLAIAYVHWRTA